MKNKDIIAALKKMYRESEKKFSEVNRGPSGDKAYGLAALIGALQGDITLLAIELGHKGPMMERP